MGVKRGKQRRSLTGMVEGGLLVFCTLFAFAALLAGCSSGKSDTVSGGGSLSVQAGKSAAPQAGKDSSASTAAADAAMSSANEAKADTNKKEAGDSGKPADNKAAMPDDKALNAGMTPPIGTEGTEGFNRKLIYKANLVMEVEDFSQAETKLRDLVALTGAYILQFTETTNTNEKSGNFTIKVAAKGFVSLLDGLQKISPSLQRNIQGQDVTEEYVDLDSRLKAKQAVETRLLAFMEKAQKTDDLIAFSNELSKVQQEIEQIKGRMRYLDQNVALSTIELRMYQKTAAATVPKPEPAKLPLSDRLQKALNGTLEVLAVIAQGLLVFFVGAMPILVLLALIVVPYLFYMRKRKQKLQEFRSQFKQNQPPAELENH